MAISEEGREARFKQWDEFGPEAIKQDLATGGSRLVGGTPEVRKLAREYVRIREAEQAKAHEKKNEVITLKPGIWGMSMDVKEAGRRIINRFKKK